MPHARGSISACRLVDPDHDEPASCRRSADQLERVAVLQVDLDPPAVIQNFRYLIDGDATLRMIIGQMLAVCGIPDDWTFVHPNSIYVAAVHELEAKARLRARPISTLVFGGPLLGDPDRDSMRQPRLRRARCPCP